MNESSRQERIIRTSVVGILVNLLIAAVKIMIGTLASSIAIVSEGINNATDAGSSFLTYIGTKLSGKHPVWVWKNRVSDRYGGRRPDIICRTGDA